MGLNDKLIITQDGSHTIYKPDLDEIYHSKHGAINESVHIYIRAGLRKAAEQFETIRILEVGFGTGLNALLTFLENQQLSKNIVYYALEPYPVDPGIYTLINYPDLLPGQNNREIFINLHEAAFEILYDVDFHFQFLKSKTSVEKAKFPPDIFHLVYFDAFSPEAEPHLWTEEIFRQLSKMILPGGILVTYSSRGTVKRNLKAVGFMVEKLPGPKGKREIIRATKQ